MKAAPRPEGDKPSPEPFVADFSEGLETGLYLALLELIDEGLIITGDEVVIEANSAACRLLERDYREIAGQPLANLSCSPSAASLQFGCHAYPRRAARWTWQLCVR